MLFVVLVTIVHDIKCEHPPSQKIVPHSALRLTIPQPVPPSA